MPNKDIGLKVAEAIQDDVNKGIVRIDSGIMHDISVRPGEIVEIAGERTTVAIVDRAYPGDIGLNIMRMDGITRRNAKTGIGETVKIKKADYKEAKKVIIAPTRKDVHISAPPNLLKQGLLGRAVIKGDIVSMGGTKRRRTATSGSPFFDEVFSMFDETLMGFGFGDIKFIVADTNPKQGAVIITDMTEINLNPEAVELEKEEGFPEVSYEDIGGLKEEIKKIREMVELPLKHPEVFERLGIDPPKGVLLHGPPGTGKTLLAKAVANETQSNFILINGPEIMSKYYGQSLPGEEEVLIIENGLMQRTPIGDIVEKNKNNLEIVCFDEKGSLTIKKVTDLIKHKTIGKLLEIKTASGRSIKATDYHSLFMLGKKGIESVKTSDLIPGKSFIAVPRKLPLPKKVIEKIDIIKALSEDDFGLRIRNSHLYVQKAKEKIGVKRVAEILNIKEKYVYDIISKHVMLTVKTFLHLVKEAKIDYDYDHIAVSTKGKSIPATMEFNEDLCVFFGMWLAEGTYTNKNEVRISVHRNEEAPMLRLCNKLFGQVTVHRKRNSHGSDLIICSGVLGKIMKNVLGFNSGSRQKRVPPFVFNLNDICLSAFLRGYISGDGSLNTKTPAPMVEVTSENPKLIDDMAYLMLRFGIIGKIYPRKGRPQKRYCFANKADLDNFREIGFLSSEKNKVIYSYLNGIGTSRRDRIPLTEDIKGICAGISEFSAWKDSESIGREVLSRQIPQLISLFKDIYWDKVVDMVEVEAPEFVYDIGVDGCHNFIAGFGGIFAHNSEENIRKKFEDAEKNAPSIIFIDEIDAIATKREETRGEVERRVVAQLLALMDGLKSRGRVVVIAASNIPNMLDPALRRPGRFDREIDIGVPSKEGRLDILKIHTRNMPIEGSIYPDIVAKKFSAQIDKYIKENKVEEEKIEKRIKELKEKTQKEGLLNQITTKLTFTKNSIKKLENIKKLIESKGKLDNLSKSLISIYHILRLRDISDPRREFIEREKNNMEEGVLEIIKEIESLDLLDKEVWDKNSPFWGAVNEDGKDRDLKDVADITYGFVGADLSALAKEAAMIVLRRVLPELKLKEEEAIPTELLEQLRVTQKDFKEALKFVRPSAMREVLVEIPNIKWSDVGGLEDVKQELKEAVEWPLKSPAVFKRMGITPPKGVLLYGAPGTGKTMLAKAVANESGANFISVKGPELLSMWVGESERGVRKVFERARQTAPSIIFFDEIDALAPRRSAAHSSHVSETVVNQLLTEMDGLTEMQDIVIIAATNRPDILDTALLRPGRFDRIILTLVPEADGRKKIFELHTKNMPLAKGVSLAKLAEKTDGYVGADIEAVCREAAIFALRENMKSKEVSGKHFEEALKKVGPSITKEIDQEYAQLQDKFRQARAKEMAKDKPAYFG